VEDEGWGGQQDFNRREKKGRAGAGWKTLTKSTNERKPRRKEDGEVAQNGLSALKQAAILVGTYSRPERSQWVVDLWNPAGVI